jgi:hypothetical protein
MSNIFKVDWVDTNLVRLIIEIGGVIVTENYNSVTKETSPSIVVSVKPLVEWLVDSSIFILYERKPIYPSINWRMRHELPSCGNGYIWPLIRLYRNNTEVRLEVESTSSDYIHYKNSINTSISRKAFFKEVNQLIKLVSFQLNG